ncbi:MAG: hypothetical protein J6N78_02030 [Clostridia bacterium]|nr:hypothetical protein [Clostridia bacterium]
MNNRVESFFNDVGGNYNSCNFSKEALCYINLNDTIIPILKPKVNHIANNLTDVTKWLFDDFYNQGYANVTYKLNDEEYIVLRRSKNFILNENGIPILWVEQDALIVDISILHRNEHFYKKLLSYIKQYAALYETSVEFIDFRNDDRFIYPELDKKQDAVCLNDLIRSNKAIIRSIMIDGKQKD